MGKPSHTELLLERLQAIRAEKEVLMKRVEALSADEQRINYAVDVIMSVVGVEAVVVGDKAGELSHVPAMAGSAPVTIALQGVGAATTTGLLATVTGGTAEHPPRARQSLENAILEIFAEKTGMTSNEVVDMVDVFSGTNAKRDSIFSTLSRMVGKGLLRRDGKLYFVVTKGEGPEVGTSEPSGATTSEDGQPTSGA